MLLLIVVAHHKGSGSLQTFICCSSGHHAMCAGFAIKLDIVDGASISESDYD